jgi:hypothetical protein
MPEILEETDKQAAVEEAGNIIQDSRDKQDAVAEAERIVDGGEEPTAEGGISDAEIDAIRPGTVSATDPDFIFMLGIAFVSDVIVDPLLDGLGLPTLALPIINKVIDLGVMVVIGGWMYIRAKNVVLPENIKNRMKNMEKKMIAKINAKIRNKVAKKALKRVVLRVGVAFGIEAVPGANLFTSWIAAVLSMLR